MVFIVGEGLEYRVTYQFMVLLEGCDASSIQCIVVRHISVRVLGLSSKTLIASNEKQVPHKIKWVVHMPDGKALDLYKEALLSLFFFLELYLFIFFIINLFFSKTHKFFFLHRYSTYNTTHNIYSTYDTIQYSTY